MTDNEIIKALECMLGKYSVGELMDCTGCAFETQGLCCENASEGIVIVALSLINHQKAEIERLEKQNRSVIEHLKKARRQIKTAKAEAIKEFAQRLKEDCPDKLLVIHFDAIDNLVKEMVGE